MLVLITAGDPSGDAHAARLMAELRLRVPTVKFIGFGGPEMEMQGLQTVAHIKDLAVTGFWEVAKRYPYFRALMKTCVNLLDEHKPDVFIPVDYPGFNIRLAKQAHSRRIPVRGKHLDVLSSKDLLFIGLSKAATAPFVYFYLRFAWEEPCIVWDLKQLSFGNTLLPLP